MAGPGAPIGNQNATKQQRLYGDALRRAIAQDNGERVRKCCEKLLDLAAAGEMWAARELADRLDGKSPQAITGADGGPLVIIQATAHDETL